MIQCVHANRAEIQDLLATPIFMLEVIRQSRGHLHRTRSARRNGACFRQRQRHRHIGCSREVAGHGLTIIAAHPLQLRSIDAIGIGEQTAQIGTESEGSEVIRARLEGDRSRLCLSIASWVGSEDVQSRLIQRESDCSAARWSSTIQHANGVTADDCVLVSVGGLDGKCESKTFGIHQVTVGSEGPSLVIENGQCTHRLVARRDGEGRAECFRFAIEEHALGASLIGPHGDGPSTGNGLTTLDHFRSSAN